jgi:plastocyanin
MSGKVRVIGVILVVAALVVLAGCAGSSSTPATGGSSSAPASSGGSAAGGASGTAVSIANFAFNPADVTVKVGQSVTWTNNDTTTHTVTGADFDSGPLAPGATYSHTFATAGTFDYHCSIHTSMTGKVTVQ